MPLTVKNNAPLLDHVVGDCALGEQGIGGDVIAGDPAGFK